MEHLSASAPNHPNTTLLPANAPERILQFGEGDFLRTFALHFVDVLNEKTGFCSKVVTVQTASKTESENGCPDFSPCISRRLNAGTDSKAILACAENPHLRYIVSNTSDPHFFRLLTQLLYRRFEQFGSESGKGFVLLPCEPIEDNGERMKKQVLHYAYQWALGNEFLTWLMRENLFCSTLADPIADTYPQNDKERSGFWIIEGPCSLKEELPLQKSGLPVLICDDCSAYREYSVRILGGLLTSTIPGAFLSGQNQVRSSVRNPVIGRFMEKIIRDEIGPTLALPQKELLEFTHSAMERFVKPFLEHDLLPFCQNCTAKWKTRLLPSLHAFIQKNQKLPACLCASFAFYITLYRGGQLTEGGLLCRRSGLTYLLQDDASVLHFYDEHRYDSSTALAHAVCTKWSFWNENLSLIPGFEKEIVRFLHRIEQTGTYPVMMECL